MTPSREQILELNSEQVDLQRKGISDASAAATITVAGDTLAPAAPSGVSANAVPKGILVEWTNPSTNADSSTCTDQRWAKLYYGVTGASKAVYDGTYVTAAKQGTNSAFTDPNVGTGTDRYYVVTAMDANGNESTASSEVNSTGGGAGETTSIPDDSSGLIFDDSKGTEGVVVGDGILGIAFKQPASAWSNFDRYRLWFAVDTNGGFGAWTEITPTNRIGYLHKGLTKTSSYRYKATIVAADGTESSTEDKAKDDDSGYIPNGSANNLLIAELIFAENLICVNEVRGEHFYAQSYLAINDATFGNDGIQLEYNGGNPRAYIGDGANAYVNFDGTKLTWKAANTELDASGNLTCTSATLSGALTSSSVTITGGTLNINSGVFTVSAAGAVVASSISCTNLAVGAGSTWQGNELGTAYIPDLSATKITADTMSAARISGGTIGACTISANNITTGAMSAARITAGTMSAARISGGTIGACTISANNITTGAMSAARITTGILTGLVVRTAASDARAEMHIADPSHSFVVYDSNGTIRASMGFGGIAVRNTSGGLMGYFKCEDNNEPEISIAGTRAYVFINQTSISAAQEVMMLAQADLSEGFIDFSGSERAAITGATNSLKSVRVELNGTVYRLALYVDA